MSREFPQAIEMEKKLLSAMMLKESTVIPTIEAILDANDFYRPEHRLIYQALVRVYKRGTPPDILLVEDELKRTGDFEKVNRRYLFSLIDYEWTTSRAQEHAKTIKEKSQLRRLIETCDAIIEEAYEEKSPVNEILETSEKRIFSIATRNKTSDFESLESIIKKALERIQNINKHPEKV